MWASEKARNGAILELLERARLYHPDRRLDRGLWNGPKAMGPTDLALDYIETGSPLSHGEHLVLQVAMDLWNGGGGAKVGELLTTLDERNLRGVAEALLARDGGCPCRREGVGHAG